MKCETTTTVKINLELTVQEARWLTGALQNLRGAGMEIDTFIKATFNLLKESVEKVQ